MNKPSTESKVKQVMPVNVPSMEKTGDRKVDPSTHRDPLDNFDKLINKHKV